MKPIIPFLLLLFFSSSFITNNEFQKVIDAAHTATLKTQLESFEKSGIEKPISWTGSISADTLLSIAKSYLNTPHRMGGTSHKGIDCSGLVYASFQHFGISLPHSSHELAKYGKVVPSMSELKKGDLVFFYNSYKSRNLITHTGIYLGNGEIIHTSHTNGVVIISLENSSYWKPRFLFGTRPLLSSEG